MSEETVARQATLTEQLSLLTEHLFSIAMEPHTPSSPFSPHTMSFGESPDESIEEGLDMMLEMIGHKCSICFVEDSALELPGCGDQFCIECLDHYWTVKLEDGGWGIRPVPIDCPVCRAKVDVESLGWELWASDNLLLLYRRYAR